MTAPALSVVIPALNEASTIGPLLEDLSHLALSVETIVVDGGSSDGTSEVAAAHGATVLETRAGRGGQLRHGAAMARGGTLFFVHADVRVGMAARAALTRRAVSRSHGAWAFRLRIAGANLAYRFIELGANARSRVFSLPYGDQGLVIARATYDAVGGYADVPIMEDVLIARALAAVGGIGLLPETIDVSARRWERDGAGTRSVRNIMLLARFYAGADPASLARVYGR